MSAPCARGATSAAASRASICSSHASGNFVPCAEKSLMPLSWNGLWEAESTMPPWASSAREERDARRREHADRVAVGAGREETRHHGRLEQRPREARVAADHESHALAALLRDQRGHELAADAIREVRRQRRLVGHTADAVRAEQTIAHRSRRISTVTCTVLWVVGYTESGRSSPTVRVTLWRRPVTSTGAVSTVARSSIVVRGPFTWTVGGSTTTRPSWTSGGGEPRSCGTTRSARVAAVATATRTQFGETRTTLMPAGACT